MIANRLENEGVGSDAAAGVVVGDLNAGERVGAPRGGRRREARAERELWEGDGGRAGTASASDLPKSGIFRDRDSDRRVGSSDGVDAVSMSVERRAGRIERDIRWFDVDVGSHGRARSGRVRPRRRNLSRSSKSEIVRGTKTHKSVRGIWGCVPRRWSCEASLRLLERDSTVGTCPRTVHAGRERASRREKVTRCDVVAKGITRFPTPVKTAEIPTRFQGKILFSTALTGIFLRPDAVSPRSRRGPAVASSSFGPFGRLHVSIARLCAALAVRPTTNERRLRGKLGMIAHG